ncbi:MAG: hypothetical protein ACK42I_07310, partial [Thermomicrobium sp.]
HCGQRANLGRQVAQGITHTRNTIQPLTSISAISVIFWAAGTRVANDSATKVAVGDLGDNWADRQA